MSKRGKSILIGCAIFALSVPTALVVTYRSRLRYEYQMLPVRRAIRHGEQGWPRPAIERIKYMEATWDNKVLLVDYLIAETDSSLVAEAMVMAVRIQHPRAKAIVTSRLSDTRWNWSMASNDDVARNLLRYLQDDDGVEDYVQSWIREGL